MRDNYSPWAAANLSILVESQFMLEARMSFVNAVRLSLTEVNRVGSTVSKGSRSLGVV